MDKLVIDARRKDENPRQRGRPNSGEPPDIELSGDQNFTNVEDEVFVKNARHRRLFMLSDSLLDLGLLWFFCWFFFLHFIYFTDSFFLDTYFNPNIR